MNRHFQGCVAEFVGTFIFVFLAIGSIILAQPFTGGAGTLGTIALTQGLALGVMITATMYLTGGQLNPAVSLALAFIGKQKYQQAGLFIAAQVVAAVCAAAFWQVIVGPAVANSEAVNLGATVGRLTTSGEWWAVLGLEMVATFTLMTAVLMGTVDERAPKLGGFVIGLTYAACIMAIFPLTGGSMNPARSFGPALIGTHWDWHWAYWVAPFFGAIGAAQLYKSVWTRKAEGRGSIWLASSEKRREAA